MKLESQTILEPGKPVRVGNERGHVIYGKLVDASNGGKIALHKIRFTQRFSRGFGSMGILVTLKKPVEREVNYSFIETLE